MKYAKFLERFYQKRLGQGTSLKYILKQVPKDKQNEFLVCIRNMIKSGKLKSYSLKNREFIKLK